MNIKKSLAALFLLAITMISCFSTSTLMAEEKAPEVDVNVFIEGGGFVEIKGDKYLPEETIIKDSGAYTLEYPKASPGEVFHYTISQTNMDDARVIYDKTIYYLDVYIYTEGGISNAVAVLHKGDEQEKPAQCDFINKYITGNVYAVYRIKGSDRTLRETVNVCPVCILDDEYFTEELTFSGYRFLGLASNSAPARGKVKQGDIYVIYEYEEEKNDPISYIYNMVKTGIDAVNGNINNQNNIDAILTHLAIGGFVLCIVIIAYNKRGKKNEKKDK